MKTRCPFLMALLLCGSLPINAQNLAKDSVWLANHAQSMRNTITFLAADVQQGRKAGTPGADRCAEWLKQQLHDCGMKTIDYNITYNQLTKRTNAERAETVEAWKQLKGKKYVDYISESDITWLDTSTTLNPTYHSFYVVIPASDRQQSSAGRDEAILLTACYTGEGLDTVQGHVLVKNSATNAGGVATLLELSKYFNQHREELHRDLIVLFTGGEDRYNDVQYMKNAFCHDMESHSIVFSIMLEDKIASILSYPRDSTEVYSNLEYRVTTDLDNGSKILTPVILNDPESESRSYFNYINDDRHAMQVGLVSQFYSDYYNDHADSINYKQLAVNLPQLQQVVSAFSGAKFEYRQMKDKNGKVYDLPYVDRFQGGADEMFGDVNEHAGYFGMNVNVGSGCANYDKGNLTGKEGLVVGAGLFGQWQIAKPLALRLDVNYRYGHAKMLEGDAKTHALNVPITLLLTPGGKKMFEPFMGVGALMDYYFAGKLVKDDGSKVNISFVDDFCSMVFGLHFMLGMRINNVTLSFNWDNAFTPLKRSKSVYYGSGNAPTGSTDVYADIFYFTVGFRF